jgi:TMEM175 potassium channel family protein
MTTNRMETFSDGVIAIIITIMVLGLALPAGPGLNALRPVVPELLAYLLSFVFLGIYWSNHHHMLHVTTRVNGAILWANLLLLFWLSLVPFSTRWLAEYPNASIPVACYGALLILSAVSYTLLALTIIREQGPQSRLRAAIGRDRKGKASLVLYAAGLALAFVKPWIAEAIYALVAAIWLVPDRRIEHALANTAEP